MTARRLSLRREVLAELAEGDLRAVAGGAVTNTCFSCLTFISCNPVQCVTYLGTVCRECVDTDTLSLPC